MRAKKQQEPTDQQLERLVGTCRDVVAELARIVDPMTTDDRRRTLKFRPGGETVVELVARLVVEYDVKVAGKSVDEMVASSAAARRLQPLAEQARLCLQLINDAILVRKSDAWRAATAFYSVLESMSHHDPQLREKLRPAIEFFAQAAKRAARDESGAGAPADPGAASK
jgi:hypothetical protein